MHHFKQNFISQRFADIVKALKAEKKINSYAQLAKNLNYRPQSLNEILKGRRNVNIEVLYQSSRTTRSIQDNYLILFTLQKNYRIIRKGTHHICRQTRFPE